MLHKQLAALMGDEEAWTLLSWVTNTPVPRLKLLGADIDEELAEELLAVAEDRADGMPLAYALGWRPFYGRPFAVSSAVLIPRQETEELVQHALTFAGPDIVLIDCGTGSGCIPITCALEAKWRTVHGCDISLDALEIARENGKALRAPVGFHHLDVTSEEWGRWLREVVGTSPCVLTANLPYIPTEGLAALDEDVQQEPVLALDGGAQGTEIIKRWLVQVRQAAPQARLLLEVDADNYDDLNTYCAAEGWHITWRRDAAGLLRFCDISCLDGSRG